MPNKNGSDKRIGIGIIKEAAIKLEKKHTVQITDSQTAIKV